MAVPARPVHSRVISFKGLQCLPLPRGLVALVGTKGENYIINKNSQKKNAYEETKNKYIGPTTSKFKKFTGKYK